MASRRPGLAKRGNKNGSILSFFKKVPSSQASQPSGSQSSLTDIPSSPPSLPRRESPPPPSLPTTPPRATQRAVSPIPETVSSPPHFSSSPQPEQNVQPRPSAVSRDIVIGGSDDEDDDSDDDSLPDLFAVHKRPSPVPTPRRENPCVTPKAKRTALEFHSSPLTIMPKHKYDMKALINHARKDDAAEASAQRLLALNEKDREEKEAKDFAAALREQIMESHDSNDEEGSRSKMKLVRALERAEVAQSQKRFYFLSLEEPDSSIVTRTPFPKTAAKGMWSFLRDPKERQSNFIVGQPHVIQSRKHNLPDEIFLWILDELASERSIQVQEAYLNLIGQCPEQVHRLLDEEYLMSMFSNLGATEDIKDLSSPITFVEEVSQPYADRNWSCLHTTLALLTRVASELDTQSLTTAMKILLRLTLDLSLMDDNYVRAAYQSAVQALVSNVPGTTWDRFCEESCTSLYKAVQDPSMLYLPLACMDISVSRVHELRKRMATAFFFDDLARVHLGPESVSIRAFIDRLKAEEFIVDSQTKYHELHALIKLLDWAIDDGSRWLYDTPAAQAQFDAEIDELAKIFKVMLSRMNPNDKGIHTLRIDTKTTIEWVLDRLVHSVRTKPRPKVSILDAQEKEDPFLPKQQEYMKKFLLPKKEKVTRAGL